MSDNKMTAGQALEEFIAAATSPIYCANYEESEKWAEVIRQALSAPRAPDASKDLIERCREVVDWHKTGILKQDGAIARLADTMTEHEEVYRMRMAEDATSFEAMTLLAASPEPVATDDKVHAVSLASEVPGHEKRGVIGHYKIHHNGDREGTVLGNWDWERVVADAGLTGKWMVLHFTDANDFERDWSMLDATQDSLREHAKLLKQRDSQINYLRAEVEALREALGFVKIAILEANDSGIIADTLWATPQETLIDYIDAARQRGYDPS